MPELTDKTTIRRNPNRQLKCPIKFSVSKELTKAVLREGLVKLYRAWIIARETFDHTIPRTEFTKWLTRTFGYSYEHACRLVATPNIFWELNDGNQRNSSEISFVVFTGIQRLHEILNVAPELVTFIPKSYLTRKLIKTKAILMHTTTPEYGLPISRATIQKNTGITVKTQKKYRRLLENEKIRLIDDDKNRKYIKEVSAHEAVAKLSGGHRLERDTINKTIYLTAQLPNSYIRLGGCRNREAEDRLKGASAVPRFRHNSDNGAGQHWQPFFMVNPSLNAEAFNGHSFATRYLSTLEDSQMWQFME